MVVLGSAFAAVGYQVWTGPSPPGSVSIHSTYWTTACAAQQPLDCYAPPVSQLIGTCLNLSGTYPSDSQIRCSIVSHIPAYIHGVAVAPPFSVIGYPRIGTYGCANCVTTWVDIGLPGISGTYNLTGTIFFS